MTNVTDPLLSGMANGRSDTIASPGKPEGVWTVRSLDSLSLSVSGLALGKEQLAALPKSLIQEICAGFSRIIQASSDQIPETIQSLRFSVLDEKLHLKTNSGESIAAVPFGEDVPLKNALGKVVDQARIYFPTCITGALPIKFTGPLTLNNLSVADSKQLKVAPALTGFEKVCEGTNVVSVARNGSIIRTCKIDAASTQFARLIQAIGVLGVAGGLSSLGIGVKVYKDGLAAYRNAVACGDEDGKVDGKLTAGIGASFAGVGATMVPGFLPNINTSLSLSPELLSAIGFAGNGLIILMSLVMFGSAVNNLFFSGMGEFRDALAGFIDHPTNSREVRAQQGLAFLAQQFITEGERIELENLHGKGTEAAETAIKNKTDVKWATFVRRVGEPCALKVKQQIDAIQAGLGLGDEDALLKAIEMLQEVEKESFKMRVKHLIQLLLSFVYFAAGIISFFPPLTLVAAALFLVGAAVFFLIDAQKIHNAVSGLIYNCRSTPKKRWVEPNPLTKRAVTTQLDSANVGNQWHLSKLKMKVNEAFDEIKQLHLNVMDKDGQASSVDRVKNFGHLCQHLKLNGEFVLDQFLKKKKIIDFADLFDKEESVDSSQLTYEQIRSLRVLDALQAAILQAKAELAKKNLEQPNELLELLGLKEMLGEVDLTFNEDPALPAAKMEIKEAVILGTV